MKYKVICNLQNKFNEMLLIAVSYVTTLKQWHQHQNMKISSDFSSWESQKVLRICLTHITAYADNKWVADFYGKSHYSLIINQYVVI